MIKSAVKQMIQANELPASAKNLILQTPRTSRFYLLPKIHKENNHGRPIVSACNCPTENTASYLDMVMSPLVCNLKTYVKDTNHALQIFRTFQFDNGDTGQRFLYTMDINSLYTVIPHNSGLEALKYFLNKRLVLDPPTETLTRLAEFTFPLSPIFIPLCNSHIQSLKLNYLSWISTYAFQATASTLPSTTKPLIHTAISTTIQHIPATAKRASHTASFYAFDACVLTKPTF